MLAVPLLYPAFLVSCQFVKQAKSLTGPPPTPSAASWPPAANLQSIPVNLIEPAPAPVNTPPDVPARPAPGSHQSVPVGVAYPKEIRSFVRRAGRSTSGQTRAFEELGPRFLLPYQPSTIDFVAAYADPTRAAGQNPLINRPIVLEIGFGMGEATARIAALLPETNFLCCEVHQPGVGALLKRIGEQGLHNIRICAHDAVEVIDQMLPPQSLDGIHIFFPDPWHKARHNKRRLIQPALVAKLAVRLKVGGYIHCATDWQHYAEQMLAVFSAEPLLKNTALPAHPELSGYAPRPDYRPLTKFENRGLKLGHGVWDLVFARI
ncbi:MAG: tRNA (guanosine(46)-N7)-methyltransferase TrmB [Rhodoferax sp.]|nr:tRNA (guanosine(46)-N7)-methyltransferase TrmB [Rhodoferax sp.]